MMDSCRELYSFFDISPKRQRFLDIVIDVLGKGETKKRKLKNLCKTRWIERHSTFETIYDLYEYVVTTLDEICVPSRRMSALNVHARSHGIGMPAKWTETHNDKLWAHFLFCVRDGHAGTSEATRWCTLRSPRRNLFSLQKAEEVMNSYSDIRSGIDT